MAVGRAVAQREPTRPEFGRHHIQEGHVAGRRQGRDETVGEGRPAGQTTGAIPGVPAGEAGISPALEHALQLPRQLRWRHLGEGPVEVGLRPVGAGRQPFDEDRVIVERRPQGAGRHRPQQRDARRRPQRMAQVQAEGHRLAPRAAQPGRQQACRPARRGGLDRQPRQHRLAEALLDVLPVACRELVRRNTAFDPQAAGRGRSKRTRRQPAFVAGQQGLGQRCLPGAQGMLQQGASQAGIIAEGRQGDPPAEQPGRPAGGSEGVGPDRAGLFLRR